MKLPVYRLPQKSKKKDVLHNMLGSGINAGVSLFLLIIVSHLLGGEQAGLFTLAYSTSQMMYTIGTFEMRNVQVTDAKRELPFDTILAYRLVSIGLMLAVSAVFIMIRGYTGNTAIVITLFCIYMATLALSDVFQGNNHLNGYLFLSGRSIGLTISTCALAFSVTLFFTRNLAVSIIPMITVSLLWLLLHDIPYSRNFDGARPKFNIKIMKGIFLAVLPLFLSAFLNQYVFNAPKYAIDSLLTATDQAHYGYLVMPTFVINLLSTFAFRPKLVSLSENWAKREYASFKKTALKLYLWISVVTVGALVGAYLLGIPALELLYGADLSGRRITLLMLLLAGCFSACSTLAMTLFTTMRKQKYCLIAYGVTALFSLFIPNLLVKSYGLQGAAYAYLSEMLLLFICMLVILVAVFVNVKKQPDKAKLNQESEEAYAE